MKKSLLCALGVVSLAVIALIVYGNMRKHDPQVVAVRALDCFVRNRPEELYTLRMATETSASGLDEEKFIKVWDQIVRPIFSEVNIAGQVSSERLNDPATQGTASLTFGLQSGREFELGVAAWVTEDTPRINLMWSTLSNAWLLRYALSNPQKYYVPGGITEAKVVGIGEDKEKLTALGISGMVAPSGYYLTWEEIESQWREQLRLIRNQSERG